MGETPATTEDHSLRGPIDRPALITIRELVDEAEPLATPQLDDFLNPSVLEVSLDDGLCGATSARIDVQWTTQADYKFHYTDSKDVNFRWGKHSHDGDYISVSDLEHYHPPPDASSDPDDVEDSCIKQSPEELVTRAVLKLWRVAYRIDSYAPLNAGSNPP
ncbi:hypothetical protein [Natrinema hispanicum]|uniref:Uncharacterized protein n=1 Tax=Natrinema hispanicum TaxID=392421 RepID=A0A1G6VGY7_9EURY|nr:hypothetical protein [Natrinema hispanicum]SDD52882.1 hypothetical protein SAMN05192552_102829 [Natrinema hispanicum]SEU14141.1 hypothetical protein SAMN04488694_1645 [Natrinema hispanicum]